jgi:DNA polymerase-3 subunit beta
MKFTTTKEKILEAVLLAERITGKKESLPVLSCILLDVEKTCVVRATNLEAGIEVNVQCEVEEKGIVAVPASVFSQTLRSISAEKIEFRTEDGNLIIISKGTRTLIKSVPNEEFPKLSDINEKKGVSISRQELMYGLQSVSYAASPSMIRPELGSIYVAIKQGKILCVATDSFRLAEKTITASSKSDVELLVPLKHAQEIAHVLEHIDAETVDLVADETQMSISGSNTRYISRVVDGTFPNYREIVPKTFETEATVLKADFADMLRKARVFSGTEQHVGLHVYPKRKIFSATARSADVGEMSDSIDAAITGEDIDINFHIGYLGDCLTSVASDSLVLGFSGPGKPLVIRGVSDGSFMYLVMPLNR